MSTQSPSVLQPVPWKLHLAVLAVAVIARFFFKEHVRARLWVAIVLVLIGLGVVAEMWNSSVDGLGMIFALIAAASYTIYFLIGEQALKGMNVLAMTFCLMYYFNIGLHKISLGALILALGLLVDDAIIAVEMMAVKMEQAKRPRTPQTRLAMASPEVGGTGCGWGRGGS